MFEYAEPKRKTTREKKEYHQTFHSMNTVTSPDTVQMRTYPYSSVIQRKIGFEFQSDCDVAILEKVKLEKNRLIEPGNLVDVVADDSGNPDMSDVEFVTKPLDNFTQLINAFLEIREKGMNYINMTKKGITWDHYKEFVLRKPEFDLKVRPQVTFGSSLSPIHSFAKAALTTQTNTEYDMGFDSTPLTSIKRVMGSNLRGVVELIKSYFRKSDKYMNNNEEIDFPKMITDDFMLSRTDFKTLLQNAIEKDLKYTNIDKDSWVNLFKDEFDLDKKLLPNVKGRTDHNVISYRKGDFTRRDWLEDMYDAIDWLSVVEDHESLGEMKLDQVMNYNTNQLENVGVFEMRATQRIPHYLYSKKPRIYDFMLNWYNIIKKFGYLP